MNFEKEKVIHILLDLLDYFAEKGTLSAGDDCRFCDIEFCISEIEKL